MPRNRASSSTDVVKLYPTGNHHIPGVPAAELHLPAEVAEIALGFRPAAFTTTKPSGWDDREDPEEPITSLEGYNLPPEFNPPEPTDGDGAEKVSADE